MGGGVGGPPLRDHLWQGPPLPVTSGDIDPLSSSDFVVVYSSMALFQIEPELDSTGGLDVAMFGQGADEFITGSSATVFAFCPVPASAAAIAAMG